MTTLADPPRVIVVSGRELPVRRLNVMDIFTVGRMLARIMNEGGKRLPSEFSEEQVALMLFGGFEYVEQDALKLMASLVNLSVEDFGNLGPEALPAMIDVLVESEDLKAFLTSCRAVAEKAGRLTQTTK